MLGKMLVSNKPAHYHVQCGFKYFCFAELSLKIVALVA